MTPGSTRYSDTLEDTEDRRAGDAVPPRDTEEDDMRLLRRNTDAQLTRQLMAALAAFLDASDPRGRETARLYGQYVYGTARKRCPEIAAELDKEMA